MMKDQKSHNGVQCQRSWIKTLQCLYKGGKKAVDLQTEHSVHSMCLDTGF